MKPRVESNKYKSKISNSVHGVVTKVIDLFQG